MASSIASPAEGRWSERSTSGWRRWSRVLAVGTTAVLLAGVGLGLTRTQLFRVHAIRVEGNSHLSYRHVVRLAGIDTRDNAVWLDETAAEARLATDPWVAAAEIRIDLPWTVVLTVTERSPVATTDLGGRSVLVAADGTLLGPGPSRGLPTIEAPPARLAWTGVEAEAGLRTAALAIDALDDRTRALVRRVVAGSNGLELYLNDGIRIVYGAPNATAAKARALADVLDWISRTGERVQTVSVIAPDAPAVTPAA